MKRHNKEKCIYFELSTFLNFVKMKMKVYTLLVVTTILLRRSFTTKFYDEVFICSFFGTSSALRCVGPSSILRHLRPNINVFSVSCWWRRIGLAVTKKMTLEWRVRAGWRRYVNLESRYGTCLPRSRCDSAIVTLPSALSDLLMCFASVRRFPVTEMKKN